MDLDEAQVERANHQYDPIISGTTLVGEQVILPLRTLHFLVACKFYLDGAVMVIISPCIYFGANSEYEIEVDLW